MGGGGGGGERRDSDARDAMEMGRRNIERIVKEKIAQRSYRGGSMMIVKALTKEALAGSGGKMITMPKLLQVVGQLGSVEGFPHGMLQRVFEAAGVCDAEGHAEIKRVVAFLLPADYSTQCPPTGRRDVKKDEVARAFEKAMGLMESNQKKASSAMNAGRILEDLLQTKIEQRTRGGGGVRNILEYKYLTSTMDRYHELELMAERMKCMDGSALKRGGAGAGR